MAANDIPNKVSTCPSLEELTAFSSGKLADKDMEALAHHLAGCSSCQLVLKKLETGENSTLTHLKRSLREGPFIPEAEYHRMEAGARAIELAPTSAATQSSAPAGKGPAGPSEKSSVPALLGTYQVLEKLGQGGMGTVYKAWHTRLKRPVALKMLPADRMNDFQAVARFQREMEAVGKLDHPNIIRATDAGDVEGVHFLVMDFVDGIDLAKLVKSHGPLPVADACELIRQAAVGLQYAHQHGRVHRDIKPSNLMLTPDGQVKVLDLGLALLYGEHLPEEDLTGAGQVMGTVDFMAPEQGVDAHLVDIRADIYSLGCTLYKLLSDQVPFGASRYKTPLQKMMAHAKAPVPPIRDHRSDVPAGLVAILDRMMAKDRSQRYATPGEVAKALQPFSAGSDLPGLMATLGELDFQIQGEPNLPGVPGPIAETRTSNPRTSTLTASQTVPQPGVSRPAWRRPLLGAGILACALLAAAWFFLPAVLHRLGKGPTGENPQGQDLVAPPPGEADQGKVVKPSAPGLRALDELELRTYHPLLDQPPIPIGSEAEDPGVWRWDQGRQLLEVNGLNSLLFQLGTTARTRFTFEAGIAQAPWTGNVGVFWGYREDAAAKGAKAPNQPFAWFQIVSLWHGIGPKGEDKYAVHRGKGTFVYDAQREMAVSTHFSNRQEITQLAGGEKILVIEVERNRLKQALLGSVELTKLYSDDANETFASEPAQGVLGLITLSHHATFGTVRFIAHSGN